MHSASQNIYNTHSHVVCCGQAKDELNETPERRVSALKELRALMKEKAGEGDDLPKAVQEKFGDKPDSFLLRFIRARKFDVGRSHELMKGKWCF